MFNIGVKGLPLHSVVVNNQSRTFGTFAVKRSSNIGLRVSPEVAKLAKSAAKLEGRSVSSMIERLLIRHLVETGMLSEDEAVNAASRTGGE
jgi:hypothetical protein